MKQLYFLLLLWMSFPAFSIGSDIAQLNSIAESKLNSNPTEALKLARNAKLKAEQTKDELGADLAIALIGVAHYKIDHYDSAKIYLNLAINQADVNSDSSTLAYATYWKGNTELYKGLYSRALDLYQKVYDLSIQTGDKWNITRAIDGKASIYESLGENDKAEEYYLEALKTAKESNFTDWIPTVTFSLGNIAYKKGNKAEAIKKYQEAIKLSDVSGNMNNKANCLQQLASIYYEQNNSEEAMEFIRQAMDIFKETGSASSYSYSRLMMSTILLKDKEWDLAIKLAQNSLEEGKAKKDIALQRDAAEVLYYAYQGKKNTAKALDFHIIFHQLSETKHREELAKKLTEMELQSNFETERKIDKARQEKLNAEMNARIGEEKLMKKVVIIGFIFIALIAAVAIFAFMQKRKDTRLIDAEKRRSDELLGSLLPYTLIAEVKEQRKHLNNNRSTVIFADIKNSSVSTEAIRAERVLFTKTFNTILAKHQLESIKGDEDVLMGIGQNGTSAKHLATNVIRGGIELLEFAKMRKDENQKSGHSYLEIGIGIHTGPVIAGIVGLKTSGHDIWGDTVNIAARIEQHGMAGKVNISSATYALVKDDFNCVHYGNIPINNQEELEMYFIDLSLG